MNAFSSAKIPELLSSSDKRIIYILILGVVLPLLDSTLVNLSIDSIRQYFNVDISIVQWVTTAYMLAAATSVPLSAWLSERITAKRTWIFSLYLFLIGTILSAISINIYMLIFSRILQGIATGLLLPVMQTIIVNSIGQNKARLALATMSVPSVLAPILGPLIAGSLLQISDWKIIFWLHVPICLVSIYLAQKYLPSMERAKQTFFDYIGFIIASLGIILLILGINSFSSNTNKFMTLTTIGIVCVLLYIAHYKRQKSNSILDLGLFKFKNFRNCGLLLLLSSIVYYGGILFYPIYLVKLGGYSIFLSGILFALHGVGTLCGRLLIPKITRYIAEYQVLLISTLMTLVGTVLLFPQFIKYEYLVAFTMFIRGFGLGVLTINSMSGAYEGLSKLQVSHASSISRIFTYMGGVLGYSIVAYFFENIHLSSLESHIVIMIITLSFFIPILLNKKAYSQQS